LEVNDNGILPKDYYFDDGRKASEFSLKHSYHDLIKTIFNVDNSKKGK